MMVHHDMVHRYFRALGVRFALVGALLAVLLVVAERSVAQRIELLDFYLPTCAPCQAMAPTIDRMAQSGVMVKKVDGSRDPAFAQQMRVDSYPTFIVVAGGQEVDRIVGLTSESALRQLLAAARRPVQQTALQQQTPQPTTGAQPVPSTTSPDAESLLSASVRIVVEDPQGRGYGTGTIIDARQGEALVVTCAHLFHDANQQPIATDGAVTVELFDTTGGALRVAERAAGRVICFDKEADVALVSLRTQGQVQSAPVASSVGSIQRGMAVQSVGCDLGADPTIRESQVVDIDRYLGHPNIETTGAPIQGRSGGGLFNTSGELIGVCYAADEESDEGLYAGLAAIHGQLDRIGLSELYQAGGQQPAAPVAELASASVPAVAPIERPSRMAPIAPQGPGDRPMPVVRGQSVAADQNNPLSSLSTLEQESLDVVVQQAADSEVVLLIRPKSPTGKTEVLTLDTASPEFVAALRRLSTPKVQ